MKTSLMVAALAVTALGTSVTDADTVPAATVYGVISSWDTGCNASLPANGGTVSGGCTLTSTGDVTIQAFYANGKGSVTAGQGTFATNFGEQEGAYVRTISYFEVEGPSNPGLPLAFSANGSTTATANGGLGSDGTASAQVLSGDLGTTIFSVTACSAVYYACSGPSSFNVSQLFTASSNTVYAVEIAAQGSSDRGAFSASVDPNITFAPGFNSAGYSLVFSPDLTPAPVPLPAAAWLLLSGLGGLIPLGRRRRADGTGCGTPIQ
jgi:hypothetical protein